VGAVPASSMAWRGRVITPISIAVMKKTAAITPVIFGSPVRGPNADSAMPPPPSIPLSPPPRPDWSNTISTRNTQSTMKMTHNRL